MIEPYIWYGPHIVPGLNRRTTSRDVEDFYPRGIGNSSKRISQDASKSVSPSNNGKIHIGIDNVEVLLVQDYDDAVLDRIGRYAQAASQGAGAAIRASENPQEFLQGGLAKQSLEDIRVAFAVRGVSRVLTHQLVRTRQAAFKQQSQRDCNYGDMPEFRMPETVWHNPVIRDKWMSALMTAHRAYSDAINADIPYEDARYILPEGTTNFILCEYSLRTFIEMYAYRGCVMFQDEMVHTMRLMRGLLVESHPYLEQHIQISCEPIQKCTFQGKDKVEGFCDFPWAKESERTFIALSPLGVKDK